MTASNLRLTLLIGTQRYHGAGQNLAFTEGTQHIGLLTCPGCGARHNPETQWPGICRLVLEDKRSTEWPRLTAEGHFSRNEELRTKNVEHAEAIADSGSSASARSALHALSSSLIPFSPDQTYALCCPDCGTALDRGNPHWHALAPEREAERRFSYRISQLLIPDIDLAQIVAAWQLAIRDPAHMTVFCTDRLALPKSTTQSLTPGVLEAARGEYNLELRAKNVELGTDLNAARSSSLVPSSTFIHYAGLDMGDQCWFVARAVEAKPPHLARLLWIEPIAAERVRTRVPELFRQLGISVLCVDAGPLRDLARDLVFMLNFGKATEATESRRRVRFQTESGNEAAQLRWHERTERWRNVRAMAVEFTQREGQGLRHKIGRTVNGREYPLLAANRDETIERVVQELLPDDTGQLRLLERADGTAERISTPRFLLPTPTEESRATLDLYERHLLAGARQERSNDGRTLRYLDKCENHFHLATAYAALAELLAPTASETRSALPAFRRLPFTRPRRERSVVG